MPKITPIQNQTSDDDSPLGSGGVNPAADLIRQKISGLYKSEPDIIDVSLDILSPSGQQKSLSKHQQFIVSLTSSNKTIPQIQAEWHEYYLGLSEKEKHEVWQEFYSSHNSVSKNLHQAPIVMPQKYQPHQEHKKTAPDQPPKKLTATELKKRVTSGVRPQNKKLSRTQHAHSLLFGLGFGFLFMLVIMFGFFNERFIAPFITPSRTVTSTPIIADGNSVVGPESKIIIPKINVEIPVIYDQSGVDEKTVQKALESGVVHYANTPLPGQDGNLVIVGHSSNNIFNKGKYKFAFVLLSKMENGDTFMLQKNGKRYVYKVYNKQIVKPNDIGVLNAQTKAATATLITCDPPGTSVNRLVVVGEQISPDPQANLTSTGQGPIAANQTTILPGNAPSLWSRMWSWL